MYLRVVVVVEIGGIQVESLYQQEFQEATSVSAKPH